MPTNIKKNKNLTSTEPTNKNKQNTKNNNMILSALLCLPDFVIPHGLNPLYWCKLPTMVQEKSFHDIPLIRDC